MNTPLTRRQFLQSASAAAVVGASQSLFPAWMPRLAFRPPGQAGAPGDVLVCIFLRGGLDGLSAVVPYGEGRHYYDARPTLAVPAPGVAPNSALDLDGFFGLHPALAPLKEIYDEQDLAIVQATGLTNETRSHFDAMHFMELGTPGQKTTTTGWIGRHLQSAAWQNDSPFRAVGMGALAPESLRGPVSPLALKSIADFHFRGREGEVARMRQSLLQLYTSENQSPALARQAHLVFETIDMLQQLHPDGYVPAFSAAYPDSEFGLGLRQVAQLIKANVGLEVACLDVGGWDTHENQGTLGGQFQALLSELAQGLAAFYTDLQEQMDGISVVTMSEFGRQIVENGSAGTDHGHGNVMFLMGGGINGGRVFADWPTLAPEARDAGIDLAITTDYRTILAEILTQRIGNPAIDDIFPGFNFSPVGVAL